MELEFKEKDSSSRQEEPCIDSLYNFITKNSIFIEITLDILNEMKKIFPKEDLKNYITNNIYYEDEVKRHPHNIIFIDHMENFLVTDSEDKLNERRGRFLEKLWSFNGPCDKQFKNYSCINEAQIYYNGKKLSEKDIDIVYKEKNNVNIELHECKSSAFNSLRDPFPDRHKDKYDLMKNTMQIAYKDKMKCIPYIITYDPDEGKLKHLLERRQYDDFRVICACDIARNIVSKIDKN